MARTYVFVCDQREFKCKEIIGMCLGEVGLDITLSSFANTFAFLLASLIPLGAVQTFARQVSFTGKARVNPRTQNHEMIITKSNVS